MELNASLMLDVWELVMELIPSSKREDTANKLLKIFTDKGLDQDDFESIRGEDNYLDAAIDNFHETDRDIEEYDYESSDYDED
jgi:hypothetical protein